MALEEQSKSLEVKIKEVENLLNGISKEEIKRKSNN